MSSVVETSQPIKKQMGFLHSVRFTHFRLREFEMTVGFFCCAHKKQGVWLGDFENSVIINS